MLDEFGKWVKQARKSKRMTQTEFAGQIGVSREYVSLLEGGKNWPGTGKPLALNIELIAKIAHTLDLEFDEAFIRSGIEKQFSLEIIRASKHIVESQENITDGHSGLQKNNKNSIPQDLAAIAREQQIQILTNLISGMKSLADTLHQAVAMVTAFVRMLEQSRELAEREQQLESQISDGTS